MTQWTETMIREGYGAVQGLDGFFYSMQSAKADGAAPRVRTFVVAKNYIPSFGALARHDRMVAGGSNNGLKVQWSDAEDNALLEMRARGMRWENIGREMKRDKKTVNQRYYLLCEQRGIEPAPRFQSGPTRLTHDDKLMIVQLREQGMTFDQISERMGLKNYIARDYYCRFKRQLALAEKARAA